MERTKGKTKRIGLKWRNHGEAACAPRGLGGHFVGSVIYPPLHANKFTAVSSGTMSRRKQVYKITYPKGKIYVGMDSDGNTLVLR